MLFNLHFFFKFVWQQNIFLVNSSVIKTSLAEHIFKNTHFEMSWGRSCGEENLISVTNEMMNYEDIYLGTKLKKCMWFV